jgi:L-amino acid N-acyltransferase YncA
MFNAFTQSEFRGRGLFNLGVALASRELAAKGISRVIATINRSNFPSLHSCRRLGFVGVGKIWTLGQGARRLARTPPAASKLGIRFNQPDSRKSAR